MESGLILALVILGCIAGANARDAGRWRRFIATQRALRGAIPEPSPGWGQARPPSPQSPDLCADCGRTLGIGEREDATIDAIFRRRAGRPIAPARCKVCGDRAALEAERGSQ